MKSVDTRQVDRCLVQQVNNPLHGINLEKMVKGLVEFYGWEELGLRVDIRCFNYDPSVKSSLKFLRRTPWARTKVEKLYLAMITAEASGVEDALL